VELERLRDLSVPITIQAASGGQHYGCRMDHEIEHVLARPIADATRATWGFMNRTDMVTLINGDRVAVQRYRRREDAEYRLRVMGSLWKPAAEGASRFRGYASPTSTLSRRGSCSICCRGTRDRTRTLPTTVPGARPADG
jgi:hypothetical protein